MGRRTTRILAPLAGLSLALALAACSAAEDDEAAGAETGDTTQVPGDGGPLSGDQVGEAAAGRVRPQPGQYQSKIEVVDFEAPELTDEQIEMLRGRLVGQGAQERTFCLTPEDTEKGFRELAQLNDSEACTFSRFDNANGRIDAEATCTQNGIEGSVAMSGTGSETGTDLTVTINLPVPTGAGQDMQMTMRLTSERTGDCS